ncbi:MAG: hypothetical protein ABIT58_09170 [Ferruginibacter sp.]
MKKIITRLGIFLIVLFGCDRVIVYFFAKYIFPKTLSGESGGTVNYLLNRKKNVDFVVMGSSRAKHHINPALLSNLYNGNGYNIGINGTGGVIYNNLLLNLMLEKGVKPKMLLLQTDPYPYFTVDNVNNVAEISPLYPFMDEGKKFKELIMQNSGYAEKVKLMFHSYRYNGKMVNLFFNFLKTNSIKENNGFEGTPGRIDTAAFSISADPEEKLNFSEAKTNALTGIIQNCKANNIRLAIVFPPSYRNSIYSKAGNKKMIELLHRNGVSEIYDFSNVEELPSLQSGELWKNATHLNNQGAARFSLLLNEALKQFK